jgi:hypothetical protein
LGGDVGGWFLRDDGTEWDELAELLTDSCCLLAPERLAARAQ